MQGKMSKEIKSGMGFNFETQIKCKFVKQFVQEFRWLKESEKKIVIVCMCVLFLYI